MIESLVPKNNQDLLLRLQEATKELTDELAAIPGDEAALVPVEGEWSVKEIVCHLRDAEKVWNDRLNRIVLEDEPFLQAFTPEELAAGQDYKDTKWEEARMAFETIRITNLDILQKLPQPDWLKGGVHEEHGHMNINDLAEALLGSTQTNLEKIRHVRWLAK
jgi:uncharacterized damage-inducible protein DinB